MKTSCKYNHSMFVYKRMLIRLNRNLLSIYTYDKPIFFKNFYAFVNFIVSAIITIIGIAHDQ